jgi:hypothetical protein
VCLLAAVLIFQITGPLVTLWWVAWLVYKSVGVLVSLVLNGLAVAKAYSIFHRRVGNGKQQGDEVPQKISDQECQVPTSYTSETLSCAPSSVPLLDIGSEVLYTMTGDRTGIIIKDPIPQQLMQCEEGTQQAQVVTAQAIRVLLEAVQAWVGDGMTYEACGVELGKLCLLLAKPLEKMGCSNEESRNCIGQLQVSDVLYCYKHRCLTFTSLSLFLPFRKPATGSWLNSRWAKVFRSSPAWSPP